LPLVFTALQSLEVRNAFQLGVFRGLFSASDASSAQANLERDLRTGRLVRKAVKWPLAFRIASHLSQRHSSLTGTRSLDVLHVAAAKSLRAKAFISFDERQRKLASAVGLVVAP
jgi:predicted nucleic acid-binding protein